MLFNTPAKLNRPGGGQAVIAENLVLKQQLIIHWDRHRHLAALSDPACDQATVGFLAGILGSRFNLWA